MISVILSKIGPFQKMIIVATGLIPVIILTALLIWFFVRRKKRKRKKINF
jgi:hypothetical protein